ncbi:unnamed protein product [Merluccius merluccius]
MKAAFLVEPIVALYAFAGFLVWPLVSQYVYRRIWVDVTNTSYPEHDNTSSGPGCGQNHTMQNSTGNHSVYSEEVQRQASLFFLYSDLFTAIPSLLVTLVLVAYSDQKGRKFTIIMPLIGGLIFSLCFLAVSFFELNIYLLVAGSLASSVFGGPGTFLGGCFAYIADLCEDSKQKQVRLAGVDMVIGLLSGVASISSGYFIRGAGFNWPIFTSTLCQIVTLLYAFFLLEETVKQPADGTSEATGRCSTMRKMFFGIYQMFKALNRRDTIRLVLLMLVMGTLVFAYAGGGSSITLYELKEPLCWDEVLLGYGNALDTTKYLLSFLLLLVLTYCGVPQLLIILIALLGVMFGLGLIYIADTTLVMFLVTIPLLLAVMPFPVLRAMMSKIVSPSEQGLLFGCLAFMDCLSVNITSAVFSSLYAATVSWCPGLSFLLAAGLCLIPITLVGVLAMLKDADADADADAAGEAEGLISAEVEPSFDEDMHS